MRKEIPIVLISSNEYIEYCAVVMSSVLYNLESEYQIHFYVLSTDLSTKNKQKLNLLKKIKNFNITYPHVDTSLLEIFKDIRIPSHVSPLTYLRILIPTLLPNLPKVIFLDCDIIVRKSISELYEYNLGNKYYGIVEDVANEINSIYLWGKKDKNYYNCGILLINSEQLRKDNYFEKVKEHILLNKDKYKICDQDIINDTFKNDILRLPIKWNFFHEYHCLKNDFTPINQNEYDKALKDPAIVHFVGQNKPWKSGTNHAYKKEFLFYYKMTPFYSYAKDIINKIKSCFYLATQNNSVVVKKYLLGLLRIKKDLYSKEIRLFGIKIYNKKDCILPTQVAYLIDLNNELKAQLDEQKQKLNNLKSLIIASNLHKETFAKYKNAFLGRDVVLVATGPTAIKYKPIEGAIHVGVNGAVYLDNINLDFVFVQDNTINQKGNETLTKDVLSYNKNNCKKFVGIADQITRDRNINSDKKLLPSPLNTKTYNNTYQYVLCGNGITDDMPYDIAYEPITNLSGTAFSAIQFILYTNPQRIYLVGCDCSKGYAYDINKENYIDLSPQINGWRTISKYARLYFSDTEIISINPVGLKGIFKDMYTE